MKVLLEQKKRLSISVAFLVVEKSHTRKNELQVTEKNGFTVFFLSHKQHNSFTFSNVSLSLHKSCALNNKLRNSCSHFICHSSCSEYSVKHIHTPVCTSANQYVNSCKESCTPVEYFLTTNLSFPRNFS